MLIIDGERKKMSKYSQNLPPDLKAAVEWLYDDIVENTTILDVGCSTGYFGSVLKSSKNCQVFGVEISDDAVEARKVLDGVYSFDLDGEWPSGIFERKYDYIFFGDVLEHLKDPERVLKLSKRLLKKNGKVFVSTPNIAHLSIRLELLGGNFDYESMGILDETHLKYFTIKSFSKIASDAGYKVLRLDSSTNDFPKEVTEKILKKYGLTASNKFWQLIGRPEARIYQLKFVLTPRTSSSDDTSSSPKPIKKPLQFRDDLLKDYEAQIRALKAHADKQAEIINYYKADLKKEKENSEAIRAKLDSTLQQKIKNTTKRILNKKH